MSVRAREYFLHELIANSVSQSESVAKVHDVEYLWPPVKVEQFADEPHYLGRILRGNIFPKILESPVELFDGSYSAQS
jgi:hypothetical protein